MNRDFRHIRHLLLFFFDQNIRWYDAYESIDSIYSDSLCSSTCYNRYKKFENGDFDLRLLKPGGGVKQTFTDKELQDRLDENPKLTNQQLSKIFHVSRRTIWERRKQLRESQSQRNQVDLASQPVNQLVYLAGEIRFNTCISLLTRCAKQKNFFDQVVTGGEKLLYYKIRNETEADTSNEFKFYMWYDHKGVLYYNQLQRNEIVCDQNSQHLHKLKEALDTKRPQIAKKRRKVILLQDSFAQIDILKSVKDQILDFGWEIVPYSSSFSDIVPSDYNFFSEKELKDLKNTSFQNFTGVKNYIKCWFLHLDHDKFSNRICSLPKKWRECVENKRKHCD